jgi:hypothetical protein
VLPLATLRAAVFDIAHLVGVATPEHLGHQAVIIRRLIPRMGVAKRVPVLGKDLLEDTPVPRGCCNHRIAPSWGDTMVAVPRLYHGLPASSTPHQSSLGHPRLHHYPLSHRDLWDWENAFSYTIKNIVDGIAMAAKLAGNLRFSNALLMQGLNSNLFVHSEHKILAYSPPLRCSHQNLLLHNFMFLLCTF